MKVLIITYYWPPSGGSGVQRWLKFVKYLRHFNIEPVVYTVKDPSYAIKDETLQDEIPKEIEVLRNGILEPNSILPSFYKEKKKTSAGFLDPNPGFFGRISQYIRANYFIPDARRFWIRPSVNFISDYLSKNDIDCIITTGPPHSLHLIGLKLKQKLGIKWVADFRDPWTKIDYFHKLPLTKSAIKKHYQLEEAVVRRADTVLVIGNTMKSDYLKFNKNTTVITNGFDTITNDQKVDLDGDFSIVHIGMMNADRNPLVLWKVLQKLVHENKEFENAFKLKLVGKIADEVVKSIATYNLEKYVEIIDYLSHKKVSTIQKKAQVLLLAINNIPDAKGVITGKIFEYLQAKRPILAIGPVDGDLATIIHDTQSGSVIDFNDEETLKTQLLTLFSSYKKNELKIDSIGIDAYHRKQLTKQLATILFNLDS